MIRAEKGESRTPRRLPSFSASPREWSSLLVGTFVWAQTWTALGVVFVAAALIFIIPAVIVILKSNGGSTPH
jgi:hypothetical protein